MPPEPDMQECRILIIDDSVTMQRLLGSLLKECGQIVCAISGAQGIDLARTLRPQLVLLDVEMPGMNGYEVCAALKADEVTRDSAIIFVTATNSMESEVAALEAGAVDFITKPINPPTALARVRTHIKLQQHALAMQYLAQRDGLTGIFNRRFFDAQLELEIARHRRQGLPLGLALIDIDHFKLYNDHYGHQLGDSCLQAVANCLANSTRRPGEVMARYGGEEFVALLPYCSAEDVLKYGTHLCAQVQQLQLPHAASTVCGEVTISVGVASVLPDATMLAAELVGKADAALYRAKSAGRNQAVLA
ncbi:diguanylate cyclase domain-containing protein [Leeia sp.]|uniref:diguanylate cyclase domain-containing protein n=1 Tax=Leeia sp. TaxID=2884678 RepID=UPI0035B23C25